MTTRERIAKGIAVKKDALGDAMRTMSAPEGSGESARHAILDQLENAKIKSALGESADTIAIWNMMDTLQLPDGWTLKDTLPSSYGSAYWVLEDRLGDRWKVSVRDHPFSPAREAEFGVSDDFAIVSDAKSPYSFHDGMTELEASLKKNDAKLESAKAQRKIAAEARYAAERANAPEKEYKLAKARVEHYRDAVARQTWSTAVQEGHARAGLAKWEARWAEVQKSPMCLRLAASCRPRSAQMNF